MTITPTRQATPELKALANLFYLSLEELGHFEEVPSTDVPEVFDDFAAAGIRNVGDIARQMTRNCFFGCEADDRLAGLAFDLGRLPGDRPMQPIFSSDIGHWDVARMDEVLPEAWEHIEHGWMDGPQFRDFMCDNAVRLYRGANPHFFKGTVLDDYAKTVAVD